VPRYSMVMFHDEIPYAVALERGRIQNKILAQLTRNVSTLGAVDFHAAQRMIEERLTPISPQAPK
jgi:kynurenine 3-monooxygenase